MAHENPIHLQNVLHQSTCGLLMVAVETQALRVSRMTRIELYEYQLHLCQLRAPCIRIRSMVRFSDFKDVTEADDMRVEAAKPLSKEGKEALSKYVFC